ncbi:hypothetical protein SLEP1_g31053 [Rubroshorea leprosula]|uniref:Aminotransferase-like plant mobile domain-containing protein n=1 Tax=Rubroshorea leprosula TaxID=152421 RepID=A0AAV5K9X7_9ROSI|nr:hypothetical protein SLEP1_g31053 [Rubroshorea leprosula]
MKEPEKTLVEEREEFMVSPTGENPTSRTAHFVKPTFGFGDTPLPELPSSCVSPVKSSLEPQNLPLSVSFHGWRSRPAGWTAWVEKMAALHEPTWKKAGIHEAIRNSTYQIKRNTGFLLWVAEKWCCDTKSFVFSWGEATVTLEDMMILGGYSVLGSPVFLPLESSNLKVIEESLKASRIEIVRSKAKKACPRLWMKMFMDTGSEFEHEAFLVFWLSRYVFTNAHETIREHVFPIAIHLARGTRIALAPAVLASIYRDLCLLRDGISASAKLGKEEVLTLTLWSPFQLVQAWIWERFVDVRPTPNSIETGQPRLARWHDVNSKVEDVMLALDSAGGSFKWRPYATPIENWKFPKFYREKEAWMSVNTRTDKELESFTRCLRATELVGLDCLEQYLPHRVAMQFGMDQDIPGHVARSIETPEIAWSNYNEPINNGKQYIPSRLSKEGVTNRYFEWWKRSLKELKDANKSVGRPKRSLKSSKTSPMTSKQRKQGNPPTCTGFHQNRSIMVVGSPERNIEKKDAPQSVRRNKKGATPADTNFSLKSKSMEQILNYNDVVLPSSHGEVPKKLADNLKAKKKSEKESAAPGFPLGSSKGSAQTSKRKKEGNNEFASAGLYPKRPKKSEVNQKSLKESAGSQDLPLRKSKRLQQKVKLNKGSNSSAPIDREEARGSPEDQNQTIAGMSRSCKKRGHAKTRDKVDKNSPGYSQCLPSTIADNRGVNCLEPLAILAQKVMEDEAAQRAEEVANGDKRKLSKVHDETLLGGSDKGVEDNTKSPADRQMVSINGQKEGTSAAIDTLGLSLEARISRLERMFAELKAARFDNK